MSDPALNEPRQLPLPFLLFPLGQVVATLGALHLMGITRTTPDEILRSHQSGDLEGKDAQEHARSVAEGLPIVSIHCFVEAGEEDHIVVTTEADRQVTTLKLAGE